MTTLTEVHEQLERLPPENRAATLALIDMKTEDDMDKVLNRLDSMQTKFDAKFDAIESKFDAKFDAIESKFDSRFSELDSKIGNIRWFIGTGFALIGAILVLLPTYLKFLGS